MIQKILFTFVVCGGLIAASFAATGYADNPTTLRSQADTQAQIGIQFSQKADSLLKGNVTRETLATAISLYVDAGKSFEQAAGIYKALVPDYASKADVENSQAMMKQCIEAVGQIKERMGG